MAYKPFINGAEMIRKRSEIIRVDARLRHPELRHSRLRRLEALGLDNGRSIRVI